jgi:peroxiredoxin Q/BCP
MTTLEHGSPAPGFALQDADGVVRRLADVGPGKVIVYFYPAALTPGCTIQALDFTAHADEFAAAGYRIIGISPDTPEKLARFRSKNSLTITLLADPDHEAIDAYGVWGTKVLYGKEISGIIRSTFVVEVPESGEPVVLDAAYNVRANGHVERLMRQLGVGD